MKQRVKPSPSSSRVDDESGVTQRQRYHHGDLPTAIKAAALQLIARNGVGGFSLREAAVLVGVSPSATYRHFADKDALLGAIAADAFVDLGLQFRQSMQAVRGQSARAARERFMAQGRAYVEFALAQPERFSVMFGPYDTGSGKPSGQPDETSDKPDSPYAALSHVLDEMVKTGAISASGRQGGELLAWSAIHGLATLLVSGAMAHRPCDVPAMVKQVGEGCLRAMG
jgi:AcrR family transcriptional regulator